MEVRGVTFGHGAGKSPAAPAWVAVLALAGGGGFLVATWRYAMISGRA